MTIPNGYIYLCKIPELPSDYSHTYSFDTPLEQKDYFMNQVYLMFTDVQYMKKDQSFKIPMPYDNIKEVVNYAIFSNDPRDSKIYYAFISDMEYINENTTKIYLQLDIIQTYMFDYDLKPSFVERMHVDRWNRDGSLTKEVEPEDLELGEHIQVSRELLHQYRDQYLIVSKNALGHIIKKAGPGDVTWFPPHPTQQDIPPMDEVPGGSGPPPTPVIPPPKPGIPEIKPEGTCWRNKKPSKQLVRFVKGFEGYAKSVYRDSGGVETIGYGCTRSDQPSFDTLVRNTPAPEDMCSQVLYKDLCKDQYAGKVYEKMIKWNLTKQCQFDALLSFTYNAGSKWLDESNTLPSYIMNHEWDKVRKRWPEYIIYDDSKPPQKLPGLIARRTEEMHMFFGEPYEVRKIPNINPRTGNPDGSYVTNNNGDGYMFVTDCEQGGAGGQPDSPQDQGGSGSIIKPIDATTWTLQGLTLISPCTGKITATFPAYSSGRFHSGLDIGSQKGDLVYAPCNLRVEKSADITIQENDPNGSFGRYVKAIMLDDNMRDTNLKCWFAHLSSRWCEDGDILKRGQIVGQVGSTGNSDGPHCHFEVRESPWNYGGSAQSTDAINPKPGAKVGDYMKGPKPIKWQGKIRNK